MAKRCPPVGLRVCFKPPNPLSLAFYGKDAAFLQKEPCGKVTTVPLPGGRKTCLPGPRGGLVYVHWDDGGTFGVFRPDLWSYGSNRNLAGARRRRRRRK